MFSSEPSIFRLSREPGPHVLRALGIEERDLHDAKGKAEASLQFQTGSERELAVLRCLLPNKYDQLEIGGIYSVLCREGRPLGILHENSLLWLSTASVPDEIRARYDLAPDEISSLERFNEGAGLVRFPGVFEPFDELLENLKLGGCKSLLDMGCGAGLVSIKAARQGIECVATDINPLCLANVEYNAVIAGVPEKVRTVESDVYDRLGNARFDVITCFPPVCERYSSGPVEGYGNLRGRAEVDPNGTMIDKIMRQAASHLNDSGTLQMLFCSVDQVPQDCEQIGLDVKESKIIQVGAGYASWQEYFMVYEKSI